jgi:hypothetical protein
MGVERWGRDAEHSPPSNTEVKNEGSDTSDPPVCRHGADRDKFTLDSIQFKNCSVWM